MPFTHLHVHTKYSLLDGASKIPELIDRAKALGMDSIAITDHGVMYGVIEFYKEAKKAGIKPIIGCEVYVAPGSRLDKTGTAGDDKYYHLVLLSETNEGYANLVKIVSMGFIDGFYYRPRVDYEVLRKYSKGIIALSACLAGEVSRNLLRGMYEEAKAAAVRYRDIFGADSFFLELQDHGMPEQKTVNQGILRIAGELSIPLVATNDIHYVNADDADAHDILLCLQTGKKLTDTDRLRYEGGQYYLKSEEEMRGLFPYAEEALENTHKIARRCNVEIEFGVTKLPKFEVPEGYDSFGYLKKLCMDGLARRYPQDDGSVRAQLDYELGVIGKMGYVDYFLIVWDFIHFAKKNGIAVGPGRGSAAGSVVSYCLEITDIDPIKYQLIFERFLNPERVSMPDIDVDFCFERRQEVIDYVTEKYGADQVVQIVTFGTMAARAVVRDVGRAMDLPYSLCDQVAKMIPKELNITIAAALEKSRELKEAYDTDDRVHKLIDMSLRLEGLPKHTSTHAAGVVISSLPVMEYVPLSRSQEGMLTTQFTMTEIEQLGLLKMDFLGLRTLTVIQNTEQMLAKRGVRLDVSRIDMDDPKVFDMLCTGKNDGVFQLESGGMKSFMKELRPRNLEDLIAGISLYRPGPMDFIPQYIRGKNNPSAVTYDTPQLEPILKATYGCIVYQEQVMQIVQDLGGYSLGRADLVRRAMSKKKDDVMQKERRNFVYGNPDEGISGCAGKGIPENIANRIFDEMTDFAKYAFNKSHAAVYAVVAYQTAYLKCYYPVEFMASLLTSVIEKSEKVSEYIQTCRAMGIEILPPDINTGEWGFSVDEGKIRYGLASIKGLGRSVVEAIVEERERAGEFRSLKDLIDRLSNKEVNKRTIESFIFAGALDSLHGNRKQKMMVYSDLMDAKAREAKESVSGQMSMFDLLGDEERAVHEITMPDVPEYDRKDLLAFEKDATGVYITAHPMDDVADKWKKYATARATDFVVDSETDAAKVRDSQIVVVGGIITGVTKKNTKNGQVMAFVTLEDVTGSLEIIFFPKDYERNRLLLSTERRLFIRGRVSIGDDPVGKLICERLIDIDDWPQELWVRFPDSQSFESSTGTLLRLAGGKGVTAYLEKERLKQRAAATLNLPYEEDEIYRMKAAFGEENVRLADKSLDEIWKR
ncbi:MAG: DNA polymerase III subunit alpha [Lachnospiraceae bacterium]|nr:DNA polymerase III subunit alpha [Lachnospiraceae bacterium]